MSTPYGLLASYEGTFDGDVANPPTIQFGGTPVTRALQAIKVSVKQQSTLKRIGDGNGQMKGYAKSKIMRVLSCECVVRASSKANAATEVNTVPVEPDKITLAKVGASGNTLFNGEWVYETGGEWALSDEGEAQLKFEAFQFFTDAGVLIDADTLIPAIA